MWVCVCVCVCVCYLILTDAPLPLFLLHTGLYLTSPLLSFPSFFLRFLSHIRRLCFPSCHEVVGSTPHFELVALCLHQESLQLHTEHMVTFIWVVLMIYRRCLETTTSTHTVTQHLSMLKTETELPGSARSFQIRARTPPVLLWLILNPSVPWKSVQ